MYRLAADIFNDAAMILDCISPALPRGPRVVLLSASSMLRAICGVTASCSKASLSRHFAKWGNLGELNAVSLTSLYAFYVDRGRVHMRVTLCYSEFILPCGSRGCLKISIGKANCKKQSSKRLTLKDLLSDHGRVTRRSNENLLRTIS